LPNRWGVGRFCPFPQTAAFLGMKVTVPFLPAVPGVFLDDVLEQQPGHRSAAVQATCFELVIEISGPGHCGGPPSWCPRPSRVKPRVSLAGWCTLSRKSTKWSYGATGTLAALGPTCKRGLAAARRTRTAHPVFTSPGSLSFPFVVEVPVHNL